jgi:hypothetical protein
VFLGNNRHATAISIILLLAIQGAAGLTILDPKGDQELRIEGTADVPTPSDTPVNVDLAELTISEQLETITFHVIIHDSASPTSALTGYQLRIGFALQNQPYAIYTHHAENEGAPGLFRIDEQGAERKVGAPGIEYIGELEYKFVVPRDIIWDENGAIIGPGNSLHTFQVFLGGSYTNLFGVGVQPVDFLPNQPTTDSLEIQTGVNQTGTIKLASPQTSRYSNGEEVSFIFPFQTINTGTREETITFNWQKPDGWKVELPKPEVTIPAGNTHDSFLVVSMPFKHEHGFQETITLMAQSNDESLPPGQIEFGIRFLEVPQPAGHHPAVFIHSHADPNPGLITDILGGGPRAYMNTLSTDPLSSQEPVRAQSNGRPLNEIEWRIPLEPSLNLGIDSNQGITELALTLQSQVPHMGAVLSAQILFETDEGVTELATGTADPVDLQAGADVDMTVQLTSQALRLPPGPRQQMILQLTLEVTQPTFLTAQEIPVLMPGAKFSLPLNEYKDDVSEVPGLSPKSFTISPRELAEQVNSGDTKVATASLTFDSDDQFTISLQGGGSEYATLAVGATIRGKSGQSLDIPVILEIPESLPTGAFIDLIVTVSGTNDQGYSRFTYEVVNEEIDDDSELAGRLLDQFNQETPFPLSLIVFAIIGIAVANQRARK